MVIPAILIANKPSESVETYRKFLAGKGHRVFTTPSLVEADVLLNKTSCSLAFIGSDLVDDMDSSLLRTMKSRHADCKFVLMATTFNVDAYVDALHGSIFHEYIVAPLNLSLLENLVYQLIHLDDVFPSQNQTPLINEAMHF